MKAEDQLDHCISYLQSAPVSCNRWSRANKKLGLSRYKKCNCLRCIRYNSMDEEREAVARYMIYYYNKKRPDQQQILMEWIRYSNHKSTACRFFLPFSKRDKTVIESEEGDNPLGYASRMACITNTKVCRSAIGFILDHTRNTHGQLVQSWLQLLILSLNMETRTGDPEKTLNLMLISKRISQSTIKI